MIRAIIFDLDDTLISEKRYIKSGYKYISNKLSNRFDIDENELYELLVKSFKKNPKNTFNRLFDILGISYSNEDIQELVKDYRKHYPDINFLEDVLPTLEFIKKSDIKTGIITDGYANAQRQKLKAVNASEYFNEIIVTDELGREYWKPHPKAFEIMREKLNVEFDEMIYIGDNPSKDFFIKNIYPMKTIRILRGNQVHKSKPYFMGIKEDFKIYSLLELRELLYDIERSEEEQK